MCLRVALAYCTPCLLFGLGSSGDGGSLTRLLSLSIDLNFSVFFVSLSLHFGVVQAYGYLEPYLCLKIDGNVGQLSVYFVTSRTALMNES